MDSMLWWWHRYDLYQSHLENKRPVFKNAFGIFKSCFLSFHITSCIKGVKVKELMQMFYVIALQTQRGWQR